MAFDTESLQWHITISLKVGSNPDSVLLYVIVILLAVNASHFQTTGLYLKMGAIIKTLM